MKAILTIGIVLCLLITSALAAEEPAQKSGEGPDAAQNQKDIEICTQNLLTIGKAIETYQKEHKDFP